MSTVLVEYRERLYVPVLLGCVVPLFLGFVVAIVHLMLRKDLHDKNKWWSRFLWSGPFAAGWYLSRVEKDQNLAYEKG